MQSPLVTFSLALVLSCLGSFDLSSAAHPSKVSYNRQIKPLLSDNCYACHGPDEAKREAGLRFDNKDGATSRLASGARAIVPGDAKASRILQVLTSHDTSEQMPPAKTGKRLTEQQVDLIGRWIQEGANYETHWAYSPPERPSLPQVKAESWIRHSVDHFVLARLEKEGLPANPPADLPTLARRASIDVTGLAPTVDALDRLMSDGSPEAYEKYVDRLLSSPAYGERMASHWLDLARFADSDGYHADVQRSMWQYRDYVIKSFNENKPFNAFVIEQLAGDLLPKPTLEQRIATAFNRNGMSSTEGGADPDEYMNKYVTDRVNTFGTVFLGSTIQCAECHNHKYDPFTQKEYYQLFDFFNRVPEKGLDADPAPPFVKVPTGTQEDDLLRARSSLATLEQDYKGLLHSSNQDWDVSQTRWEALLADEKSQSNGLEFSEWKSLGPFSTTSLSEGFKKQFGPEQSAKVEFNRDYPEIKGGWKNRPEFKDGKIHNLDGDSAVTYLHRVLRSKEPRSLTVYLGSDDAIRVWLNGKEILAKEVSRAAAPNQDEAKGELVVGDNEILMKVVNGGGGYAFYFSADKKAGDAEWIKIRELAAIPKLSRKAEDQKKLSVFFREHEIAVVRESKIKVAAAKKKVDELDRAIPTIRVMEDMVEARPSYIRIRGDYRSKGEQVSAGVPVSALPDMRPGRDRNRLSLAQWLLEPRHPLTARVTVNRLWGLIFPSPLVKTSNEFGTQGELPSHPELLDYLAREFVDDGWDVKRLIRTFLLSSTYRQSSAVRPDHTALDPENRLLARGPRHRLSAEMIRDNALAVSGLIVDKMGGPSVRPYQPPGLWEEKMFAGNKYEVGSGDELYRRSLYTLWKRTVLNPTLQTFDAPDRAICSVSRPTTCTPLQALVTMNDVTYVEAARVFAEKLLLSKARTDDERIELAFRTALSRNPHSKEKVILKGVLEDVRSNYTTSPSAASKLISQGKSGPSAKIDPVQLAAWTGLVSVVLNLDEVVTKE